MSVLDEIRSMEKQVLARLQELEPALAEYRELRQVAERLGLDYDADDRKAAPRSKSSTRQARRKAAGSRGKRQADGPAKRRSPVKPGERDQQVLAVVRERPGITVPELGKALEVDYTGLYRVVRRLEESGQLRKSGSKLELSRS